MERSPFPDSVLCIATTPRREIFAATKRSILRTTTDGASWDSIAPSVPGYAIQGLVVDQSGLIYAGTDRGGVFVGRSPVSRSPEVPGQQRPGIMSLAVSPNPASSTISLTFDNPANGTVRLCLVSPLGELVRAFDAYLEAGPHTRHWPVEDVPQGVYLLRIEHSSGTAQRMVVLN